MSGGSTSGAKYHFVRELARGGMGRVELAIREEGNFRRIYAVKRLRETYSDDPAVREMFLDEARIAGMIHHPNVVSVLDVGVDEGGPYLVMDFVRGLSAASLLNWGNDRKELLPVQLCVRIVRQVADGLHAAHELRDSSGASLQVVHRDVSPQNILLGYDGAARLSDFGVARARGRISRTHTGVLKGKYGYMAPEQLRFEEPDRRADLFSLGVVFYELLSGTRLYQRDDGAAAARAILNDAPPDIDEVRKDVHPTLVELLFRMLAKDPDDRPATGREIVRLLDEVLAVLVADDRALLLEDFLEAQFGGRRQSQERELEQLRTKFKGAPTGAIRLLPHVEETTAIRSKERPGKRRALVAFVSVLAAAGAVGAVVWATGALDPPPERSTPTVEPEAAPAPAIASPVEASEPEAAVSEAAVPEAEPLDTAGEAPPEATDESTVGEPPARPLERPARPRNIQARMGQPEAATGGELYGWGE